jgi:hypothetical protein
MADLVITASQVVPGAGAQFTHLPAAAAITVGQAVYKNSSGQAALADCDASATAAAAIGISISQSAGAGQYVTVQTGGDLVLGAGAAPVNGTIYLVSDTAGAIKPVADLDSGDFVTILCVGKGSNTVAVRPWVTGGQVP